MVKGKCWLAAFAVCFLLHGQSAPPDVLVYIKQTWKVLTRSNANLAKAVPDPKFKPEADGRWPVYIPRSEDAQLVEE